LEYVLIAKVEQLYGKDGYVKLQSFSDFPDRFLNLEEVYLDFWGDKKTFYIEDFKNLNGKLLLKFKKFNSIRDCQVLIDRDIYVNDKDKVSLPDNQYFIHDLIGSEVILENESIGLIDDIMQGKANDVLVIRMNDENEKLIPFVLNFIEKFDAVKKKLILNISKDFLEEDEN